MAHSLNFTLYSRNRLLGNWWRNDVRTLTQLCEKFAGAHYSIDIVHIAENQQRAFRDGVLTTPAILLEMPSGRKQNLGGFSETEGFLKTLRADYAVPAEQA